MIRSTTKKTKKILKINISQYENSVMHVYPSLNKCTCRYIVSYSSILCTFIAELHAIIILGDFYLLSRFAVFSKKEEELAFVLTESLSFTMDTEADKSR